MKKFLIPACMFCALAASALPASRPEASVIECWNQLVATDEAEMPALLELQESYRRNRPGLVVMPDDVRCNLRERRQRLMDDAINAYKERVAILEEMKRQEGRY